VEESANNARAVYSIRSVSQVTESIQELGQLQAAMAWCRDGQTMVLTEGHTRARAIKRAGQRLLRVEVVAKPVDDFTDYRLSREVNIKRRNLSHFDDAVRFSERLGTGQTTQTELARRLEVAEDYVSKVLKIGRMPPLLLERMAWIEEPPIGLAAAYVVAQFYELQGAAAAEKLVARIVEERISVRRLELMLAEARALANGQPHRSAGRRLRPMSRTEVSGAAKGELKAFPDGRIELQLRGVPEQLREDLYLRFLKVFEEAGLGVTGLARPPHD
jgi:ParB family chromosome partitioning protein